MGRVFVEGDHEALDRIIAALRAAGLSTDGVELVVRPPEVRRLPSAPGQWAAYADLGPDLSYADWRAEILSLVTEERPGTGRLTRRFSGPEPAYVAAS